MNAALETIENPIAEFNEFDKQLNEFLSQYEGVVYDLTDPKQEKTARSDKYAIGKAISALDARHKEIKAPLKERVDLIDGERKRIKDGLLEVQGKIKSQIEAHEKAIEEHAQMLQEKVDQIRWLANTEDYPEPITAEQIQSRLDALNKISVDDSYEDRKADATLAQVETVKKLEALLAERQKYEAEQAELERLRKEKEERARKDREESIRKEAEERAKREAEEKAEREKKEAEAEAQRKIDEANRQKKEAEEAAARAEREKKEAAERAAAAERERIEQEQKQAAEAEERKRKEEEEKKAKQQHRAKIHKEAKQSLIDNGVDEETATLIVELAKDGKIKNMVVEY